MTHVSNADPYVYSGGKAFNNIIPILFFPNPMMLLELGRVPFQVAKLNERKGTVLMDGCWFFCDYKGRFC